MSTRVLDIADHRLRPLVTRLGRPVTPLQWYRWILLAVTLINAVLLVPVLLDASSVPGSLRVLASAVLLVLSWWWIRQYRVGDFAIAPTLLEAAGLCIVSLAVGDPVAALGLVYLALYYRSLSGSAARVITGALAYLCAHFAAAFMSSEPTIALSMSQVILQVTGIPIGAAVLFIMGQTLRKQERSAAREQALVQAGAAAVACTSVEELIGVVTSSLRQLVDPCASNSNRARSSVVLRRDQSDSLPMGNRAQASDDLSRHGWSLLEERITTADGDAGLLRASVPSESVQELGDPLRSLAVLTGLALERLTRADEVRRSEARFRSLVQNAPDLISLLDANGIILDETPAVDRILGYPRETRVGASAIDFVHPDDLPGVYAALAHLASSAGATDTLELRARHADGRWLWLWAHARNELDNPDVRGLVVNYREITAQKNAIAQLEYQARHDSLTGLPNRQQLMGVLDQALQQCAVADEQLALLLLDLDGFKEINDTLGHEAGDRLLREIGPRLQHLLNSGDLLARLGGDEFAIMLPRTHVDAARAIAVRALHVLQRPFIMEDANVAIAASVGIAAYPDHGQTGEALLRTADIAMYVAKRSRAGCAVYDPATDHHTLGRLALAGELRHAITAGELVLHYQPKVDLRSARVIGAEALVRWRHPEQGIIAPDVFLPLAARAGLMPAITDWVLGVAANQQQMWRDMGLDLGIALNFSSTDLQDPDLIVRVERILSANGHAASGLTIEITEDSFIRETGPAMANISRLRDLGFDIAIDDFGTGYSSLARLNRLPVDELKIDRSFIQHFGDKRQEAMVRSIIDLGRNLNLRVVAEGIEDAAAWHFLRVLGCDQGQGYFFGKPVPVSEFPLEIEVAGLPSAASGLQFAA